MTEFRDNVLPIPDGPEGLTPAWLTQALKAGGRDVEVARIEVTPLGVGVGMMSRIYRVAVDYAAGTGPAALVVKIPTPNEQNRQVAVDFDNYRREVEFYRRAAHRTPMRTPALYCAAVSGSADFVLVLEDLSGWGQGDQVVGASREQADACMTALGQLHASFWNRVDDGALDWVPDSYPSVMSDGLFQGTQALYGAFNEHFGDIVPAHLQALETRYVAALPGLQRWINGSPRTLVHGDFRMDNLFFAPGTMACCDWQGSVRGRGIHDVAYFLSGSVATELRRRHERDLLTRWLDALRAGGVAGYDADQAWHDYRHAVLVLWSYVVVIGGGLDPNNRRGNRWITEMVRRSCAAMDDLDCPGLIDAFV
jgi:hypothetical protein